MLIIQEKILSHVKKNDLHYSLVFVMVLAIFSYATNYLFNVLLAHYLRPALYGDYCIAIRFLGLLTSLALLGTNFSSRRFLSNYLHNNDNDNLQNYLKWNIKIIRTSIFICIIVALLAYIAMHLLHVWQIKDIRTYHLAIYMLWIAPLSAIFILTSICILCAKHEYIYRLISSMTGFINICVFMCFVFILNKTFDSYTLVSVLFISFSILITIAFFIIIKKSSMLSKNISTALRSKHISFIHPDWITVSTRMAANGFILTIISSIDLITIEIISPMKDTVGLYAAALTISSLIGIIPQNIFSLFSTQVARLYGTEDGNKQLENTIKRLNKQALIVALSLGGVMIACSKILLHHFGPVYLQAEPVLMILILSYIINALYPSTAAILGYAGYEKTLVKISTVYLFATLILCIVFTYFFGIVGTAMSTLCVNACKTIAGHVIAYKKTNIKTYLL